MDEDMDAREAPENVDINFEINLEDDDSNSIRSVYSASLFDFDDGIRLEYERISCEYLDPYTPIFMSWGARFLINFDEFKYYGHSSQSQDNYYQGNKKVWKKDHMNLPDNSSKGKK